ncbi:hypothetical protein C8P68_10629 [Mucilaginibacter yixingensis]|uniref:Uncharacterized protein n=1 Tax=Mucilaginibacter yixingensis TaxID=1295612 RepID=A0A2T5J6U1_9SPHI|nr:hypothetical protein [Mucilaginibacter yixingensis]PTQ94819.1 hypothetical protein C8P68_10629 [Mucilaginibacter yixingensis]
MTKISEQAVTNFLVNKILNLQKKVNKTQALLSALKENHDLKAVGLKKKDKKDIKKAEYRAERVQQVQAKAKAKKAKQAKAEGTISEDTPAISLDILIKKALEAGPAYRQAIAEAVAATQPAEDAAKIGHQVETKLREMVKSNELKAEKEGSKNKYSLIPQAGA